MAFSELREVDLPEFRKILGFKIEQRFNPPDPFNLRKRDILAAYHDFLFQIGPYVPLRNKGHLRFFRSFQRTNSGTDQLEGKIT